MSEQYAIGLVQLPSPEAREGDAMSGEDVSKFKKLMAEGLGLLFADLDYHRERVRTLEEQIPKIRAQCRALLDMYEGTLNTFDDGKGTLDALRAGLEEMRRKMDEGERPTMPLPKYPLDAKKCNGGV